MKLRLLSILSVVLSCVIWLSNSNGALPQNTGAPQDLTCGRAPCHNIPVNVGDANIEIDVNNGSTEYQPGSTLSLIVSISNAQSQRNGFQIVALDEDEENIGTWILTAPDEMKIIDGIGLPRKYVTHQSAGNLQDSWMLNWEAPQEGTGDITFYASVLDANNNGNNTGDAVYTTFNTLSEAITNTVQEPADNNAVRIYPNPAHDFVYISNQESWSQVYLYNLAGQIIKEWEAIGFQQKLMLPALEEGAYLLVLEQNGKRVVKKLMVH